MVDSVIQIDEPFQLFHDIDGTPLEDGYIYIGESGLDPITNQINIFSDAALSLPMAQPVRTIGGYPMSAGTPTKLFSMAGDYSMTVLNKRGTLIYTALSASYNVLNMGVSFSSLESFRASNYGGSQAIIEAANEGSTTGRMILVATGTSGGVPTTEINRFSALSSGEIINEGGFGYGFAADFEINQYMFGAVGDGVADDSTALQLFHNTGRNCGYAPGNHLITSAIQITAGANLIGSGGQISSQDSIRTTKIVNNQVGGGIFWYTGKTIGGGVDGPEIAGFVLQADYPIRFNDRELNSADGSNQPVILRPNIHDCEIQARTPYVGIGIDWARCFDGVFCRNHVTDFQYGMVLSSSDINNIYDNRFIDQGDAHIIVYSSGTFGSSNEIKHNDLLVVQTGGRFIITTDHHARIYNNYIENAAATVPAGGIDVGSDNMPAIFGVNALSICYTCVITDNRNDLFNFAGCSVYRIEPTMVSCKIYDVGTTGPVSGTAIGLNIKGTYLPVYYNSSHVFCNWDFRGEGLGVWNGFKTGEPLPAIETLAFGVSSFASLNPQSSSQNAAGTFLRYDFNALIILPTFVSQGYFYPPQVDSNNNVFLNAANTYTVTVVAKTDSALGDQINMARNGAAFNLLTLTQQYDEFTFTFAGQAIATLTGVIYQRVTANGNIKIKSVKWKKV